MSAGKTRETLQAYEDTRLGDLSVEELQALDAFVELRLGAAKARGWQAHPLVQYTQRHTALEEPAIADSHDSTEEDAAVDLALSTTRQSRWAWAAVAFVFCLGIGLYLGLSTRPKTNDMPVGKRRPSVPQKRDTPALLPLAQQYPWVKIVCFLRPKSPPGLVPQLRGLGFPVKASAAKGFMKGVALNTLWFGHRVPDPVIKAVASALLRQGVGLRAIRPFSRRGSQPDTIQIGADLRVRRNPIWKRKHIQEHKFQ